MTSPTYRQFSGISDSINPLLSPRNAIADLYRQYLGRDPETEGWDYWTNAANSGSSLADIQSLIQNSPEAQAYANRNRYDIMYNADGTVYNPLQDKKVDTTYTDDFNGGPWSFSGTSGEGIKGLLGAFGGLGTNPVDQGYSYRPNPENWRPVEPDDWLTPQWNANVVPDSTPTALPQNVGIMGGLGTQGMLGTQGQLSGQPSDQGIGGSQYGALLNNMYNQYLGRNAEAEGANYWSNQLAGGASEDAIRNAIQNSPEAQQYAAKQAGLSSLA